MRGWAGVRGGVPVAPLRWGISLEGLPMVLEDDPEIAAAVGATLSPAAVVAECDRVVAQLGVVVVEVRALIDRVNSLAAAARRLERRP
jgi:hypothetical protein